VKVCPLGLAADILQAEMTRMITGLKAPSLNKVFQIYAIRRPKSLEIYDDSRANNAGEIYTWTTRVPTSDLCTLESARNRCA